MVDQKKIFLVDLLLEGIMKRLLLSSFLLSVALFYFDASLLRRVLRSAQIATELKM